jgi:tetratricopeptide (TPR) repeat protein
LGRLQGGRLRGVRVQKIVVYPVRKGDTLRALARRTYRTEQLSHFLADYNGLASLDPPPEGLSLKIPVLTGVPASVRAETGQEVLRVAQQRRTNQEYEEACRQLAAIPEGAPAKAEADRQLALCRAEGESYFLRLGDQAFQASDPRKACQYWEKVLVLNPANQEARKKLEEAKDLMATLDRLPALREPVH